MTRKQLTSWVAVTLLSSSLAIAQVATGSIAGTVMDPNGASIPGAKLVATNTASGVAIETTASESGLYVFPSLQPGNYSLVIEHTGFKKLTRSGLEVRIAQRIDMNLTLEVGDMQQSIEVTGEIPLLETTSSQRGQNLSTAFMNNLPFFSGGVRNPRNFVSYMPGVSNVAGEITVSGAGARAQEILIDGASATIPESGGTSFNFPAAEMFGEFKLLTGTFDAEYGRFGGGIEIYVTKSGTNDFHGTSFLNLRRDIWNANSWANNARGTARPKERFTEYGFGGGGPVLLPGIYNGKNKTFFFGTYSKDKRPITATQFLGTVPTALMKTGNFSEVGQIIYDPNTTSGSTRLPFAGNIIPTNRFSGISSKLLSAIPNPTRLGVINNYDFVSTSQYDRYIYNVKIDHAFTPGNRLAFTVTKERELTDAVTAFAGPLGQGLQTYQRPDNWRWNHDLVIRPNILLHTTFGYSRTRQFWSNPNQFGAASAFGFPGLTGNSDSMPRVAFAATDGYTPWGVQDGKVANGSQINRTFHLTQGLSIIKGKHEMKMGYDWRKLQTTTDPVDLAGTNGQYNFARAQTALPTNLTGSGNSFASLLLGLPDNANRAVTTAALIPHIRYDYAAVYFQDNWKVTPRLTLSLGFRYDVPTGFYEENGDYSSVNLALPNLAAGGRPGALEFYGSGAGRTGEKRPYPRDFSEIGPRLGFSYRILNKTVIRGGYGIYYQTLGGAGCGCRTGWSLPIQANSDGVNGALQWDNGIQAPAGFVPPPVLDPTQGLNASNVVLSDNFGKAARIHTFSFNIQHEVGKFLIDIAYQGTRGRNLNSTIQLNQLPTSYLSLGSLLQQRIDSPAVIAAGFTKPYASFANSNTLAQALRPYPQYLDVSELGAGIGRNWYDSLQAKVERRFGDWQLMGSYTFSKTLGLAHYRQVFSQGGAVSGYNVSAQDNYNYAEMKSYMPFDLPHVINIMNTYELPFGKGRKFMNQANWLTNLAVGGWSVSMINRYQSGPLLLVQAPANTLGTGVLFTQFKKANRTSAPIQTGIDRTSLDPNDPNALWLNAGAFTTPGQYELGNAAQYYGDFRNPPILDERISIQKRMKFPISGDRTLDLIYRADAFNAFNRTSFGGINAVIGNAGFGRATTQQTGARLITMGLRADF